MVMWVPDGRGFVREACRDVMVQNCNIYEFIDKVGLVNIIFVMFRPYLLIW